MRWSRRQRGDGVAIVDRAGDRFVFTSNDQVLAGFWVLNSHLVVVDGPDTDRIGREVRGASAATRHGVVTPPRDGDNPFQADYLRAVDEPLDGPDRRPGQVVVRFGPGSVIVRPWRNAGPREGFVPMMEHTVELARDMSDEDLGAAVLAAFDHLG